TDETLVYQLTKALWGETSKQLFNSSYIGQRIEVDNSLKGIGIPLHRGAKKYYNEIGKHF
ncbi:MAG: TAXI family TRAP transporter solute-binding subunit, partial [Ostreibacterium sp.]